MINATSIDLGGRATIDTSTGPNQLTFSGNVGGDVTLSGINTLLFDGEINTGTSALGGHCMSFVAERSPNTGAGVAFNIGSGGNGRGVVPPASGRALSLNFAQLNNSTVSVALMGSTSGTLATVNVSSTTNGFSIVDAPFVANERLFVEVTSGTTNGGSRVLWTIIFD